MKANDMEREVIKFLRNRGWIAGDRWLRADKKYDTYKTQGMVLFMNELRKFIEAKELVDSYGGLEEANKVICNAYHGSNHPIPDGHEELSIAIQLVESVDE